MPLDEPNLLLIVYGSDKGRVQALQADSEAVSDKEKRECDQTPKERSQSNYVRLIAYYVSQG